MLSIRQEEGVQVKVSIEELPDNALVGTKVAAEILVCSTQCIRNWVREGKLEAYDNMLGGANRFLVLELRNKKENMKNKAKEKRR
jgi:Tfp pilus assembly pilus retraction ATPase PilT